MGFDFGKKPNTQSTVKGGGTRQILTVMVAEDAMLILACGLKFMRLLVSELGVLDGVLCTMHVQLTHVR